MSDASFDSGDDRNSPSRPAAAAGRRRQHAIVLALTLAAAWLLWSGHHRLWVQGIVCCGLVIVLAARMRIINDEGVPLARLWWRPFLYLPWLAGQIIAANVDVARRILSPSRPISPRLIEVRASQRTQLGQVIYANSITLTPGTISIRIRDGVILVHSLSRESGELLLQGEMNRRVQSVEGEA